MILGVDVGGTFTDAVAIDAGGVRTGKAPTTPDDQSVGVMAAIEQALGGRAPADVERLVHGMTVGTNALLEGRTARTALIATEGFTDVERLGRQARPELYRLCADNPPPIVPDELLVAAPERCTPDGVLAPLDGERLRERLAALPDDVEAVAICLLWGFRHPEHEPAIATAVGELLDGVHVSASHETAAVFREYERSVTTIVDATVSPLLGRYIDRLTARAGAAGLPSPEIMLSSGGVVDAAIDGDEYLAPARRAFDYMLNALRLNAGFPLDEFEARTGVSRGEIASQLDQASGKGWIDVGPERVVPTELGRRFANDVIALFL